MKKTLFAILPLVLLLQYLWAAEERVLWQIGNCDNSFSEFAIAGNVNEYPRRFANVDFTVGKSEPAKDWPFIQPGPVDQWAGSKVYTQNINFDLDTPPEEVLLLTIDLVDAHSQMPPAVEIRVNKKAQVIELQRGVSDESISDPSNGREQILKVYISSKHLVRGRNSVRISSISGSWILYDCISLTCCSNPPDHVVNLSFEPTFFYKKSKQGLAQIMRASMDLWDDHKEIKTQITSERGWKVERTFRDVPGGKTKLDIEVPEVNQPQNVKLKLQVAGKTYEADAVLKPEKKWKIYLAPSTHFDIGYTGRQDRVMEGHRENLERAMDWCSRYPGFVWNLEGSYLAEDFLTASPLKQDFIRYAKQGAIGVQAFYGNELTGVCSNEGLVRLVDYYDFLRKEYGIESKCMMQTDVPSMVATVPMILAGHGVKYLSHGINATRVAPGLTMIRTPFYWQAPDGSRILVWRTYGYGETGGIIGTGDSDTLTAAGSRINGIINEYSKRKDYPFDAFLLHGGYGDNQPNRAGIPSVVYEWNRTYEYPKLIFCRGSEFFEYIESNFKEHIKTVKGDGGVYWEDGVGSSAAETAANRIAKEQLVTAEKLTALCDDAFRREQESRISKAWSNILLYDEHTWGAAQSIDAPDSKETREQWEIKKSFADSAAALTGEALEASLARFCQNIEVSQVSVVVFNPSSWERSEWVEFDNPNGSGRLRLYAESVPSMGYKVFPVSRAVKSEEAPLTAETMENSFYSISFDKFTGAVKSVYDKELKRELVDSSTYSLNCYLYVDGATSKMISWGNQGSANYTVSKPEASSFELVKLPGLQKMRIKSNAAKAKGLVTEVLLHENEKKIEFINILDKEANLGKEAGYFAFPFAFKNPSMRLEIPNGVIRPELDQLPGACRDWYAVQHFLTVSDDSAAVTWIPVDSPLVTLQDINKGQWYQKLDITNGNVFAYVFNNYWFTNYKAFQDGKLTFRFAMTSGKQADDYTAKKFGESVQCPLICKAVTAGSGKSAEESRSFLQLKGQGVVVQALKPARFTNGTVVRLREMSGKTQEVVLVPNGISFKKAYACNLAEDKLYDLPVQDGMVQLKCRPYGLVTVLLER